ncbi:MAG: T9SS type B sorting domain-containing protein [Flavobacterium sp.]|uniref:T9SS type B sorting domain-containing protein n=1 Tax=Flavobacterium sp. TaxID=239 RepID=UPI0022BDDA9D|nr:T9SS type B sorting domain-containing protein [Flavobacterium sp.]MCZ8196549.1 T9SS type B sorting domain-containing protein [Flavobacterium sp.]
MKTKLPTIKTLLLLFLQLCVVIGYSQPPDVDPTNPSIRNKFDARYNTTVRGDMLIIGNNIVSRHVSNAYNGNSANDQIDMVFVDIDNDVTTRNSSSAKLTINDVNCSKVVYAGLYWAATYRYETGNVPSSGRFNDWNQVKFKVPGGSYVNVTATDILYDGFGDTDPNLTIQNDIRHGPYSCYADVTPIISALLNPNGDYYVGNIRVSKGGNGTGNQQILGGVAGGWSLVIVYENVAKPSKYITTFDGHAVIKTQMPAPMDIHVSGFQTLPSPQPVNARIGVMALEGDTTLSGDKFSIKSDPVPTNIPPFNPATYTDLSNPGNAGSTNFFNSSITLNGVALNAATDRNPNSIKTLGWDSHLNKILQTTGPPSAPPYNQIIPNNGTGATLRLTTNQDKYDVFFSSFDVEVIAPEIPLIKTVRDIVTSEDLDEDTLTINQGYYYSLIFQNNGNDNAVNFTITDILPENIIFPPNGGTIQPGDVVVPAGSNITYTYNSTTKTFVFTIPNDLVIKNGAAYEIKIYVRTPASCEELVNACSNFIQNQAFVSYQGEENSQSFDSPSYSIFDLCTQNVPGPTNYLVDIHDCIFESTAILCGNSVVLTAPNGYATYQWENTSGQIIGTTQSIVVSSIGNYIVHMTTPAPCKSIDQIVHVVPFANAVTNNPVIPFADEVVICPNNGEQLPKIFLCGTTDNTPIHLSITDATSIIWQQLVVASCAPVGINNCPNTNPACTWNTVGTGQDYIANTAGQYRVIINYQNGCFKTFYFNVYKNNLAPTIIKNDIVCNTPGSITVNNVPAGYTFSLSSAGPWQTSNTFPITVGGTYTVFIKQTGVDNGCIFELSVTITQITATATVVKNDILCNGSFGSIRIDLSNSVPQYYYTLSQGATVINTVGPVNGAYHIFSNLNSGTYTITATTDDGCTFTQNVTINNLANLTLAATVSQHISCTQGNIQVNPTGGQPPYNYAIYSYNGNPVNPANYDFQTSVIFDVQIGGQGNYQFIVIDSNGCSAISNTVTINLEPPAVTTETHTNVTCFGLANGTITVTATPTNGYALSYSIDGTNYQPSNVFSGLAPGTYTITVKYKKGNRECFYTIDVTITQPNLLVGASQLVQNLSCTTTGTIQAINVSGGTTPYQYSINGGTTWQSSNVFPNLSAGNFTITIRDANGCLITTTPIQFTTPTPLTDLTFTSTPLTCPTLVSTITATVVGGTSPYVFQIISPSIINPSAASGTTATFPGLAAGTYTIRVTDAKGCSYEEIRSIQAIDLITVNGNTISNVQCYGTATGSALFAVANFNTTYSYTLNGGTPFTNQTATSISLNNLVAGTYTVVVTDSQTNCQATRVVTVTQPSSALQLSAPFTPKTCIANGSLNATASGGWGSYQYTLTQPDTSTIIQLSGVFGNLSQTGPYTISVQDANNCIVSSTFTINATTNPDLTLSPTSNLCISNTSGATLIVTTTGGTPGYQYQINGGTLQNSGTFANLGAGTYTIRVVDTYGCEDTITQIINPQLTAQAVLTKTLDCTTNPQAILNVSINGGLSPYQYQVKFNNGAWGTLNPVTGSSFTYTTGIAGNYQFQITDAQGCVFQTNTITISPISNPSILSIVPVSPLCGGDNNGTLTVNLNTSFGTSPFQYNINGGTYQTSNVFTNLIAGTYTIGVKDSKDCVDTETFVLTQPQPLLGQSLLVQPLTCIITTGTIQATAISGGTAPYQYSINGITFVTNPIFTGLSAGTYTITIKDANGCIITTNPITLTVPLSPTDITLTSSAITCPSLSTNIQASAVGGTAPFTYQIISPSTINPTSVAGNTANFNNLPVSATTIFTVKVTDANGCVYQKNIPIQSISLISVSGLVNNNVACLNDTNGRVTFTVSGFSSNYSYSVNSATVVTNQTNSQIVLSNLAAGNYSILVRDLVTNCTATTSVTVLSPSAQLALTAPFTQPTCTIGGSVNATATGGWGSYQYTLTYPSGTQLTQSSGLFTLLPDNINPYTIKVTDANGCEVSQSFTLNPYVNPSIVVDLTNSDLCYDTTNGASFEVIASGGTPNYQYQIQLNGGSYSSLQNNAIFTNLSPGNYTIQVVDAFGCTATVSQVIVPQLLANATLTKSLDCSTSPNATISINITGGTAPYQYQININNTGFGALTNVTSNPINYIVSTAGTYQFSITDSAGCNFVTNFITVNPITNPSITSLVQTTQILCNGNNNASITTTINTSSGIGPFQYSIDGTTFQASPTFSGLTAGTYTVTVRDSNLCTDTETITINQPNSVVYNITKTDILCTGSGTQYGQINVENTTGGTQPYTYYLSNNFGLIDQYSTVSNENHTFIVLNFGIYSVEVIDANGCSLITNNIIIASPPNDLDIDVSTATANCASGGTAIITVSSPVASGSYAFAILTQNTPPVYPGPGWIPADAGTPETATFTGLIPGVTYTFIVLDLVTNCYYFETANAPIITPSTITTTIDVFQNVSCTGSGNGSVSFSMTNFDPSTTSVSYQIFNSQSNTPTTPVYTGSSVVDQPIEVVTNFATLPPGIYYLLITENDGINAGCTSASASFPISQSTNLLTVTATATNDNCNTNAGVVTAIGQYGTPGYNFIIRDAALAAPLATDLAWNFSSVFNVESGNYIVYIKDANGCIQQTPINVGLDTSPEITSVVVTNPCANEGSFEVTVTLDTVTNIGISPYTYQVDGGVAFEVSATTFTVPNLFSGNHTIRITDANGCFFDFPFTINQNLSGNVIVVDQPTCIPAASGSIQVSAANGTGVYTFTINTPTPVSISNGTNTATFTGLSHGNYVVTINDGNCSIPLSIQLEEPNPVDFTLITQNPSCNGDTNGVIEVLLNPLNDNNPPYTYTLSAPSFTTITQNNGLFNLGLGENNYTVTVESSRGCQLSLPITLTDPDPLVASDTNVYTFTCTNSGIITIDGLTVTGGNSNYSYSLDNINFQPLTNPSNIVITDTGVQQPITVYIKDGKGCSTSFSYLFETKETISNPSFTINPLLSCAVNEQISISFTGNPTGNYTYQLLPSGTVTPFTGTSFTPPALNATGQYTYEIIDTSTGCSLLATHNVMPYPVTNVTAQPTQAVDCFGNSNGQLSFTLQNYTGSYNYNVFTSPGNVSMLSGSSSLTTFTTTATLAAGNYYVVINENAYPECTLTSPVITIDSPAQSLAIQLVATNDRNCLTDIGTILATATGGTSPYQYQLSNAGGIVQAFSSNNYFENLANGNYTVSVTDGNGCQTSDTITIGLDPTPEISLTLLNPCAAEGQFEIEVNRTIDGIAPYTYIIDGSDPITQNATPFVVTSLLSGLHTIRLTDSNGCFDEKTITILPVLSGTITSVVHPSCANNDGVIDADATNGSGGYTYILQNNLGVTIDGPNNTGLFNTNLGHGDYTVVITDNDPLINCSVTLPVTLEQPTPVNYTLDVVQPSCNTLNGGIPNGSITVQLDVSNNNPPYTYSISDGVNTITQNNGVFTGLAGSATGITYTITVESNRGCQKVETVTLQTPPELVIPTIIVGSFGCNTTTNSPEVITITVPTPSGGTSPYLYSFDGINFSNLNTFDIIDNGSTQTVTVTVKDANSCIAIQTVGPINPLIKVDATVAQVSALTCNDDEVVQITIIGDPTHNYTYQLLPSIVAIPVTSNPFTTTLSQPGTYNYLIVDTSTNCSVVTNDYVINPLPEFEVNANPLTDVTCYNGNDGTMNFTVSNYNGSFNYEVIDETGNLYANGTNNTSNNPIQVTGLIAGNYTISVSIPNNNSYEDCTKISNVISIGSPQELQLTIAQTSPVTCINDKGTITVTSTIGGSGSYEYQLVSMPSGTIVSPYSYSLTSVFTGLGSGDYRVLVRDTNAIGCEANQLITLNPATIISATYNLSTNLLDCFGDNNASVTVTNVTGGQGSYQYTLTYPNGTIVGPQQSPTFTGLGAGVGYVLSVTDGWDCDVSLTPFTINEPTPIQATLSLQTGLTCAVTPQVEITATGGTPPYIVNGLSFTSSIILNATMPTSGAGVFQYTVTDSKNCTPVLTNEISINPIAPIVIDLESNVIEVNCNNDDNAIIVVTNTTGGLGNYQYYLQDSSGTNILGPNTNGQFNNIEGSIIPGETYYVYVTSGDCNQLSSAILVSEPVTLTAPTVTVKNVKCAGEKNGEISVTLSGGVKPYQFAISPNLAQTIDPLNPDKVTLTNLGVGTYTVLYQDANGCFNQIVRTVTEPSALMYNTPVVVDAVCDGESGSISITASGGTPGLNGYEFSFNNENNYAANGTNTFTVNSGVFGGQTYTVYVRDANGCKTDYTRTMKPTVDLSSNFVAPKNCDSQTYNIEVFINDNLLPTTQFSLDNQNNYQDSNVFTNVAPGNHIVYIKNDNGCIQQTQNIVLDPFVVLELSASETGLNQITAIATGGQDPYNFIFNGNNNGSNNVYIINYTGQQIITVIDDNGCEKTVQIPATFYEIEIPNYFTPDLGWTPENIDNFDNIITKVFDRYGREVAILRKHEKWYGEYRGNPLPAGDYWYLVEVNDGAGRTFVGNVTLYR